MRDRRAPVLDPGSSRYQRGWGEIIGKLIEGGSLSGGERDCVFLNSGGPRFANVSGASGIDFADDGRAVAAVDWDGDGDLDLWEVNRTAPQARFLRNDAPARHFVSFGLRGRSEGPRATNRDAIGARVAVTAGGRTLVRGLRAGEGFLSQTTKEVHVGLGDHAGPVEVTVTWPGGERESFGGVRADHRYVLVQGRGEAEETPPRGRLARPVPPTPGPPPRPSARIPLSIEVPLPALEWEDLGGVARTIVNQSGHPLLVNLFASYCKPCLAELKEMTERWPALSASGLKVAALSVEKLDPDTAEEGAAAVRALAAREKLPFEVGFLAPQAMKRLETLNGGLFNLDRAFPLPTSFLVDGSGRVAMIYKAPVTVEALLADVAALRKDRGGRDAALPFPGRWQTPLPPERVLVGLGARYVNAHADDAAVEAFRAAVAGHPDDASTHRELGASLERIGDGAGAVMELETALRLDPREVDARLVLASHLLLGGRSDEALRILQEGIRLLPRDPRLPNGLGLLYARLGRTQEAIDAFAQATAVAPDSDVAHQNLAHLLVEQRRFGEALPSLEVVARRRPDDVEAHQELAAALEAVGRTKALATEYRVLVRLLPDDPRIANRLAFLLATDPSDEVRNGAEAVRLAIGVVERTGGRVPEAMTTLAAAHAEVGHFEEAVRICERAASAAETSGDPRNAARLRQEADRYRAHQPLRVPAAPRPR